MTTSEDLEKRQTAYQLAFMTDAGRQVLDDLKVFCRAETTCFHQDPRVHAALEGRREIWLRIQDHLNMTQQELLERYTTVPNREG